MARYSKLKVQVKGRKNVETPSEDREQQVYTYLSFISQAAALAALFHLKIDRLCTHVYVKPFHHGQIEQLYMQGYIEAWREKTRPERIPVELMNKG